MSDTTQHAGNNIHVANLEIERLKAENESLEETISGLSMEIDNTEQYAATVSAENALLTRLIKKVTLQLTSWMLARLNGTPPDATTYNMVSEMLEGINTELGKD